MIVGGRVLLPAAVTRVVVAAALPLSKRSHKLVFRVNTKKSADFISADFSFLIPGFKYHLPNV